MLNQLSAKQIREWDAFTIKNEPITSIDLMERAAHAFCTAFFEQIRKSEKHWQHAEVNIFCGPGNNGGDGLAIARLLLAHGYKVKVYVLDADRFSDDFIVNEERLNELNSGCIHAISKPDDMKDLPAQCIIIDALFGTGLNKGLEGLAADLIVKLNSCKGLKFSVDIPSGLPADLTTMEALKNTAIFEADYTFTFQVPKQSFMFAETAAYVGEFFVLPIGLHPDYLRTITTDGFYITADWVQQKRKKRAKFSHKGSAGHALMIAGSYGKLGAALLSSKAALRAGCGLLTAFVPKVGYTIFQTAFPEAMVQTDEELYEIRNFPNTEKFDAIGVGPGMGLHPYTVKAFGNWIKQINQPILIDADALNASAELMKNNANFSFPKHAILTPHPKEFERLAGKCTDSLDRLNKLKEFAKKYQVIVVLKGAHTSIALPNGCVYFNLSGNPLLATAGSGDVLSGIITSLLAQGYSPEDAAMIGVWLHGALADQLLAKGIKQAIAGDFIEELKYL